MCPISSHGGALRAAFWSRVKYEESSNNAYEQQQHSAVRSVPRRVLDSHPHRAIHGCNYLKLGYWRRYSTPFFIKPKLHMLTPVGVVHTYPFQDAKGQTKERHVCEIQLGIDNMKGRASAIDVDIIVSVQTPKGNLMERGVAAGYIAPDGDRKLRHFFHSQPPYGLRLYADELDTLYEMADVFAENLLCGRVTLPKDGGETAIVGYGIEGVNHVLLGEFSCELPIDDYVFAIVVSNDKYGQLVGKYFKVIWHQDTWDQPKFTEFKPNFVKRSS